MKTLKQVCTPRASVFDPAKRDTVLSLNHLVRGHIDPGEFFADFRKPLTLLITQSLQLDSFWKAVCCAFLGSSGSCVGHFRG